MNIAIMEDYALGGKRLPFRFDCDTFHSKEPCYFNWHENIEILCCNAGKGVISCNGIDYTLSKGDTCLIGSMVIHATSRITDDFSYYCLIVDRNFCIQNTLEDEKLLLTGCLHDEEILRLCDEINSCYVSQEDLYEMKIRIYVLQILCGIYRRTETLKVFGHINTQADTVRRILIYINEKFNEKITLDDISVYVGINRFNLTHIFKRITGKTIFEHINDVRCREAKRLIDAGCSISEAAWKCGYRNSSYFSKTYKRVFGVSPSQSR